MGLLEIFASGGGLFDNWLNAELKIYLAAGAALATVGGGYFKSRTSARRFSIKDVIAVLLIAGIVGLAVLAIT